MVEIFKKMRGKKLTDLGPAELDTLTKDKVAIKIARKIFYDDEKWAGMDQKQKLKAYKEIRIYLENFHAYFRGGEPTAIRINKDLNEEGLTVLHALQGCYYAIDLGSGKTDLDADSKKVPKLYEIKEKKFTMAGSGGGGRATPAKSPPTAPVPMPPGPPPGPQQPPVVNVGGGGGYLCPVCGRMTKRPFSTLKPTGNRKFTRDTEGNQREMDEYICDHCRNRFLFTGSFMIAQHPDPRIFTTFICPECRGYPDPNTINSAIPIGADINRKETLVVEKYKDPVADEFVYRIKCTNANCRAGDQPWFIDLAERDYEHWKSMIRERGLERLTALKARFAYNPNARSSRDRRIKREIDRMEENIRRDGFTDVKAERFEMDPEADATKSFFRGYGFDPDRPKRFSEEEQKGFEGEERKLDEGKAQESSKDVLDKQRAGWRKYAGGNILRGFDEYAQKGIFTVILAVIAVVTGALLGWPFLVAFSAWAARNMLPDPKPPDLISDWEGGTWGLGSLMAKGKTPDGKEFNNRYSTGISAMKSLLKMTVLIFLGIGFFTTELPFRGFVLLAFCFISYFSLPGEYDIREPQKFIEGILRIPLAMFLAFVVFWGIFGSSELAWLTMAFFAVFPVATSDRAGLARAIGQAGSGVASTFESFDKIIFAILMFIGLWSVMGGAGLNLELGSLLGNVFVWFWIISLVGGLTSPSQVRPYTGIIMLVMVFIFYSSGVGEQIVGQGFFGAWWPTVHNGITSITKPIGEAFASVQGTFGQTFLLLTNPVAFSKQIMEGSYVKNPTGPTGAYGLEIENLVVPAIYPGTYAMATFNIKNAGPVKAKNVSVRISVPADFKDALKIQNMKMEEKEVDEYSIIDKNDIMPVFFILNGKNCKEIENMPGWYDRLKKRNEYIRVNISVEYEYEVSSWMPLTIISPQEWKDRTSKGTFAPAKVGSFITTSPAKLSIGSFDQPLIGGARPFYLGFNLTPGEPGEIDWTWEGTKIMLNYSSELENGITRVCNPKPTNDAPPLTWTKLPKYQAVFCTFTSTPDPQGPSKTYYITASASFRFKKTETKDTLFAFSDVCGGQGIPAPPEGVELGPDDIKNVVVNVDSATNRVTVTWDTTLASFSEVLYKRQSDSDSVPFVSKKDTSLTKTHQMVLEGLDAGLVPNAVYMLKVKSGGREKDGGTFKTGECNILNKETCVKYSAYCEWKYDNTPQAVCQPKNQ